jgi:hypothetical protein
MCDPRKTRWCVATAAALSSVETGSVSRSQKAQLADNPQQQQRQQQQQQQLIHEAT